jgi:hypothetical protein
VEEALSTTRGVSASVPPPRRPLAMPVIALVALALGVAAAAVIWLPSAIGAKGRIQSTTLGAQTTTRQIAHPNVQIELEDVAVQGEASEPGKPRSLRSRPRTPATKKSDCKQLYYMDSTGIRRVKRDCL